MTETTVPEVLAALAELEAKVHGHEADRDAMVREARRQGATWLEIGEAMGISKQSAWERYRNLEASA